MSNRNTTELRKFTLAISLLLMMLLAVSVTASSGVTTPETFPSDTITGYHCNFSTSGWDPADWLMVQSPITLRTGKWDQEADHIANQFPEGSHITQVTRTNQNELYVSMVLKKKVTGPATISTVTSFEPEMAPLILLADTIEGNQPGDYICRKYIEVVIYNKGINIWQHKFENGKRSWEKVAWSNFELKPNTKYKLTVKVDGKNIEATVDGHSIGYKSQDAHNSFYAGITACEGFNQFYSFDVEPK